MSFEELNNHEMKRPGGPLKDKPVQAENGQWYNVRGEAISEDQACSAKFWMEQPEGMRETMVKILHEAVETGSFYSAISPEGISGMDKEKLSAYRVLAEELGYKIGKFVANKNSHTAGAPMSKRKPEIS